MSTRTKEDIEAIDQKFILALDQVIEASKELGIKPNNDSAICRKIYPSNASTISNLRRGKGHIPMAALVQFAKLYNADMNYFFHEDVPFEFDFKNLVPELDNETFAAKFANELSSENELSPVTDSLATYFKLDTMIKEFTTSITDEKHDAFYNILHIIQYDSTIKAEKLENTIVELRQQISQLNNRLLSNVERAFNAQESEKEILKKYIEKLEK